MQNQQYLDLYYQMVLIRIIEEEAARLYQQGKIGGFLHLYIGQEAVSTGVISTRKPQDRVITAYRDHGVAINCGVEPKEIMAELLGKVTGCSKGRGGSMHLASVEHNFWGGHAVVGAHLPVATGLALGDQYQENDNITICMFGEGATNIGYFHEALNLSKVWELPILWICENNIYGMGTPVDRASAVSEIRQKAEGYLIPNRRIDGMDVLQVREAAQDAMDHIRKEGGPRFLEIMTYRYRGHSMGDPERYRDSDEIRKWQETDPIGIFEQYLYEQDIATIEDLKSISTQVESEVQEAIQFAETSPNPPPDTLFQDVYVDDPINR